MSGADRPMSPAEQARYTQARELLVAGLDWVAAHLAHPAGGWPDPPAAIAALPLAEQVALTRGLVELSSIAAQRLAEPDHNQAS